MTSKRDVLAPQVILKTWLLAASTFPAAMVFAAVGQGIGSTLGGCRWIGVTCPVDRPAWALVNEPTLSFAATDGALGYWLGSWVFPLVIAAGAIAFIPRTRSVAGELSVVQLAWGAVIGGVALQPVLDPATSHIAQWSALHDLPDQLVWFAPAVAGSVAFIPALRVLALAREGRRSLRRVTRLAVVVVHLVLPAAAWGLLVLASGGPSWTIAVAVAAPSLTALAVAFYGLPPRLGHRLAPGTFSSSVAALLIAIVVWAFIAVAGAPTGRGLRSGVLWAEPNARNNLRDWVNPRPLPWVEHSRALPIGGAH